jgi:hypothetical protein
MVDTQLANFVERQQINITSSHKQRKTSGNFSVSAILVLLQAGVNLTEHNVIQHGCR